MRSWLVLLGAIAAAGLAAAAEPSEFMPPTKVLCNGKPIDVDIGHAAPFYGPIDGDGVNHLLVGQFGEGKLRIYRNACSKTEPRFKEFAWFLNGDPGGRVPTG